MLRIRLLQKTAMSFFIAMDTSTDMDNLWVGVNRNVKHLQALKAKQDCIPDEDWQDLDPGDATIGMDRQDTERISAPNGSQLKPKSIKILLSRNESTPVIRLSPLKVGR